MRLTRFELADDRDLPVVVAASAASWHELAPAVGECDEPRRELDYIRALLRFDARAGGCGRDARCRRIVTQRRPASRELRVERRLQRTIGDHVSQCREALFRSVETKVPESISLRDVDCSDRRDGARRSDRTPDVEPLEDETRPMRQRQRAIAARSGSAAPGVQRDHVELAVGKRQRERRANRAGTDDDNVTQHETRRRLRARGNPVTFVLDDTGFPLARE